MAKLEYRKKKLKEAELIIQTFNPKPGLLVSADETQYVTPDIYVQEMGENLWYRSMMMECHVCVFQSLSIVDEKGSDQTDQEAKECER